MSLKIKSGKSNYSQFTNVSDNPIAKLKQIKKLCKNLEFLGRSKEWQDYLLLLNSGVFLTLHSSWLLEFKKKQNFHIINLYTVQLFISWLSLEFASYIQYFISWSTVLNSSSDFKNLPFKIKSLGLLFWQLYLKAEVLFDSLWPFPMHDRWTCTDRHEFLSLLCNRRGCHQLKEKQKRMGRKGDKKTKAEFYIWSPSSLTLWEGKRQRRSLKQLWHLFSGTCTYIQPSFQELFTSVPDPPLRK